MNIDGWSVSVQYRKCGKSTCKICREGKGHGPYYYGTRSVGGKKEIRYFGRSLPKQPPDIQPDIQPEPAPVLTIDDHIRAILSALGRDKVLTFPSLRRDILYDLYVPEHTRMYQVVKQSRGQQTVRLVERADYVLPANYVLHIGKSVLHLRDITSVWFQYFAGAAELRMTIYSQSDAAVDFVFRGLDVVKMALWLKDREHTYKRNTR